MSTHYSMAQKPADLISWAHRAVEELAHRLRGQHPVFCYRGMSGVGTATALAIAWQDRMGSTFGMVYVRKADEGSHGRTCEHNVDIVRGLPCMFVFVDDFTTSGATRKHAMLGVLGRDDKAKQGRTASYYDGEPRWWDGVNMVDYMEVTSRDGMAMRSLVNDDYVEAREPERTPASAGPTRPSSSSGGWMSAPGPS